MRLDARQQAVGGNVAHHRKLVLDVAGGLPEDVVGDVVAEDADFALEAITARAQREVEAERVLRLQVGVADLVGQVTRVGPEVIQLFERGIARRPRQVDRDHEVVVGRLRLDQQADRTRELGEVARPQTAFRLVGRVIEPAAELHRGVRRLDLFVDEAGIRVLIHRRRQRLGADGVERAGHEPAAEAAHQPPGALVRQQHLALDGVVAEGRADLLTLELGMLIATHAQGGAIRLQPAGQVLGAGTNAERVPLRREADGAIFNDRDAVLRIVVAVAGAEVRLLAGPGAADLAHRHARLGIRHLAFGRGVVARPAGRAAEVQRESAVADVHVAGAAGRAGVGAVIHGDVARRALGLLARDGIGNHVDEAADGVGAVEQRGRPADHFNAARRSGIGRHGVVARLARQVAHALAVFEHGDAVAVKATNDRAGR